MAKMGFADSWIRLIMRCVLSVSNSIKTNGDPSLIFKPTRGPRLKFPIFFILYAEVFSHLIQMDVIRGSLIGIGFVEMLRKFLTFYL